MPSCHPLSLASFRIWQSLHPLTWERIASTSCGGRWCFSSHFRTRSNSGHCSSGFMAGLPLKKPKGLLERLLFDHLFHPCPNSVFAERDRPVTDAEFGGDVA